MITVTDISQNSKITAKIMESLNENEQQLLYLLVIIFALCFLATIKLWKKFKLKKDEKKKKEDLEINKIIKNKNN